MKITAITLDPVTGGVQIEIDSAFVVSIPPFHEFQLGDEVELAIRKSSSAGSVECPVCERPVDSPTPDREGSGVRAPTGKSDKHF